MKKELNIAAILKDKPAGTKLWSPMIGDCIYCYNNTYPEEIIIAFTDKNGEEKEWTFSYSGRTISAPDTAEVCLFPSKYMQDWSKFSWKKGDVLVSNDGKREVFFKTWERDSYTKFVGLHCLIINDNEEVEYDNGTTVFNTNDFKGTEVEDVAQSYINTVEERLGGKLNLETLEIEKQTEFKDGDIVVLDGDSKSHYKTILLYQTNIDDEYEVYSLLNTGTSYLGLEATLMDDRKARLATDSEKKQLFEALAKENKVWNAEKKQVVDLKIKWIALKPFDKVITRNSYDDIWTANIFSHMNSYGEYVAIGCVGGYHYCLPYNEETAHLVGTTDEWKGGEQ